LCITANLMAECLLWVKTGCGGCSSGTSAVPQKADDIGAPRKSSEVGHLQPSYAIPSNGCLSPDSCRARRMLLTAELGQEET
jgi:hypothetical protein